ncbi:copia-type polyprotein, partial [Trifolium medium]|nr:copia-type polyprotein [Trifolium medium]
QKYAAEILSRFDMQKCNKVCSLIVPDCKLVKTENGKASDARQYKQMVGCLMYLLATKSDIAYSMCLVARVDLIAICNLKGGYIGSDYAGDLDDRKNTFGFVFMLGTCAISLSSKKQPIATLSTTEAEFVAQHHVLVNVIQAGSTRIHCDNSSSIKLSKNPIMHGRCKHIDVRFHFLRDLMKYGIVELIQCKVSGSTCRFDDKAFEARSFL